MVDTLDGFPEQEKKYNQMLHGFYGEFGTGADAQIFYLQSALRPADLDRITLISDIPGAETWSVRDLFQREIDIERVTNGLLPYFRDDSKVKFFNPLTLTILPVREGDHAIDSEMPILKKGKFIDGQNEWISLERPGIYRYRYIEERAYYGAVEWNDTRAKVVAIDGQHRLSALKRFFLDAGSTEERENFLKWTIPVVVFSLRSLNPKGAKARVLDVIRSVFIYINTAAKPPNKARQILLSDESINSICTQELLEYSHENDVQKMESRDWKRIPLLFYDWRGHEKDGKRLFSPASLKPIEEIRDWFSWYIFGEDFKAQQEGALGVQPIDSLHESFTQEKLNSIAAREVRQVFRKNVQPGVVYFLENFKVYETYIESLKKIEQTFMQKSDVARHAFQKLRFGSHQGGENLETQIRNVYDGIIEELLDAKKEIPYFLALDIGMRGIVYAFGFVRNYYNKSVGKSDTWVDYSKWFTKNLNYAYEEKMFTANIGTKKHDLLLHVTHDHNGSTINYRLDHAKHAFGAYVTLLVTRYGMVKAGSPHKEDWQLIWDEHSERLSSTLIKGYKKQVRVVLREQYPNGGKELNKAVKEMAEEKTYEHMAKLEKMLNNIK